jgi:hypothetical protein
METNPRSLLQRESRAAWATIERPLVAGTRGARRDSLMTAMNCNYLEKLELGKR